MEPVETMETKSTMKKTLNNPIKQKTQKQREAVSKRILEALINREAGKYLQYMDHAIATLPKEDKFLINSGKYLKTQIEDLNQYIRNNCL